MGLGVGVTTTTVSATTPPAGTAPAGTTAAAPASGPGVFGDLGVVCGPGDAKGSTDQGISDTEIVVGTAADPTNTFVPGLGQEHFDAADAFVAWCNEAGGILGRKLKLNKHDTKLTDPGTAIVEACQTDFMLVGDGVALDSATVEPRTGCGLPQIAAYTVSQDAGRAKDSIESITNNDRTSHLENILRTLQQKDPEAVKSVGVWNNSLPSVIPTGNRSKKAAENLGMTISVYEEMPQGVDNWRPYVEKLKEQNVQVLIQYLQATPMVAAMKAMSDVGYFPKYILGEGNLYDATLVKEGGDNLSKTTWLINLLMWPFEDAKDNPPTQQFLDILNQYVSGAVPKSLSINSFSAWLLFAKAATACGSDLTRACVMFNASQTKDWSGGGLHVPSQPGPTTSRNSDCYSVLTATPAGFAVATDYVAANDKIYNCDPKNSEPVAGLDP